MNEESLRTLLRADGTDYAGDGPPDSRVDLGEVVRVGRRRRRMRAVAGGAAAAAVVVLGLLASLALALPNAAGDRPAAESTGAPSVVPRRVGVGGFDPVLVLRMRPGWLPAGVTAAAHPVLWAAVQSERYAAADGTTDFTISLYAPGFAPRMQQPGQYEWQWAPHAHATIVGRAPGDAAANRALWQRIAEQLATDARRPVPVPGYVTGAGPRQALVGLVYGFDPAQHLPVWVLVLADHAYVPEHGSTDGPGSTAEPASADPPGLRVALVPGGRSPEPAQGRVHVFDDPDDWTIDPVR
ncbi:hypothetical protein Dvina_46250 [Dactylosporangium vinaceum]|uniref:Uncharacterized protein n=1 Tax=Dactylosporangium vinaceum TaxID=53362 RepID=A0ABV5M7C5_9ACTN|nr:hypothetical protein [Dactylosporangium vinaceum]UAB95351.1 hypothetical protein Dvina_46250 [Dactylosporangium vinaceum]